MRRSDIADIRSVVLDGQPRPVLFLGAGASVTSGVPLVRQLTDLIGRHAFCRIFRRDPDDPTLMRSDWYPWVSSQAWYDSALDAQELYARHFEKLLVPRERRRQFLQEHVLVNPENASAGYHALASLVGKRRVHSILTTNFDTLAIDSCKRDPSASSVVQIQSPNDAGLVSTDPAVSQVIHVHGVVDQYADLNLTEEVAELDSQFANRIVPIITDHPLIVVGYRGAEPSVYRDLLLAAASAGPTPLPHGIFWCHRVRDGDLHEHVAQIAEVCGANFALVEIEGFDELMTALDDGVPRLPSSRPSHLLPFDGRPSSIALTADHSVDWDTVATALDDEALGRLALPPPGFKSSNSDRLLLMNLLVDDAGGRVLTNAGRILFSPAGVTAHLEASGDTTTLKGNLFRVYDALSEAIAAENQPYRLKGPESTEVRPYPPMAVKELLVNALVHRDYQADGPVEVSIDDQRLRITNPGGLVDANDIDLLGERSIRHYRNPAIAEALYAAGLMDKFGSGLVDVAAWARDGGAVATFDVGEDNEHFEVVLTSRPDSRGKAAAVMPDGAYEIYYVNALRVRLPDRVWVGPTAAHRASDIYSAHPGEPVPRFVLDGRNLLSFSDLSDAGNPLHSHVEAPERHLVEDICSSQVGEAQIVELLNRMFERHMQDEDVEVHHRKQRIWFHLDGSEEERIIHYQARTRRATRTVARIRQPNTRWTYYEHQALSWSFVRLDGEWLLTVNPTWIFTSDGRSKLESRKRSAKLATRKMSNERNLSVLNHVYFWAWAICGSSDSALLQDGSDSVRIERLPLRRHEAGMQASHGSGEDDLADPEDLEHIEEGDEEFDGEEFDDLDDEEIEIADRVGLQ